MKSWKRIEPTKVTQVGYRVVITKTFVLPDGSVEKFDCYNNEGEIGVGTIALTRDRKVIVFRQFRPGPEQIMDELPGGDMDADDQDPEQAALRELEEETGYKPARIQFLGVQRYNAYSNECRHYFLATDCELTDSGQQPDPNEVHGEVRTISIEHLLENAKAGRITDPGAVLLAYDTLLEIREKLKHESRS